MKEPFAQVLGLSAPHRDAAVDFRRAECFIVFEIENTPERLACPVRGTADQFIQDGL